MFAVYVRNLSHSIQKRDDRRVRPVAKAYAIEHADARLGNQQHDDGHYEGSRRVADHLPNSRHAFRLRALDRE